MEVRVMISDDEKRAAIFFPQPPPGFTLTVATSDIERLIDILVDVRARLKPSPAKGWVEADDPSSIN